MRAIQTALDRASQQLLVLVLQDMLIAIQLAHQRRGDLLRRIAAVGFENRGERQADFGPRIVSLLDQAGVLQIGDQVGEVAFVVDDDLALWTEVGRQLGRVLQPAGMLLDLIPVELDLGGCMRLPAAPLHLVSAAAGALDGTTSENSPSG